MTKAVVKAVADLFTVLDREFAAVSGLLEFSVKKEELIISGDADELRILMEDEEPLISEMKNCQEEHRKSSDVLASAMGAENGNYTLKELTEMVGDSPMGKKLATAGERLTDAALRLEVQNAKIKELLTYKIDYIDLMIKLLLAPTSKNNSYDVQGTRKDDYFETSFLDCRG